MLDMASAGIEPRIMGKLQVPAVDKLLERKGLNLSQVDVIELNEAFAAQALAVIRELEITDDNFRVNPNGGRVALGHLLSMFGARLLLTAAFQLQPSGGHYARWWKTGHSRFNRARLSCSSKIKNSKRTLIWKL